MADKITPKELREEKDEYTILDVREADELEEGQIGGAVNIPLGQLIRKARHGDLDDLKRKKIVTYCNSGYRGNIAADELNKQGFNTVTIEGGYSAWKDNGNKKRMVVIIAMSKVWNNVYKSNSTFFGEQPSNFALICFNHMKTNNVKKVLELGAGHGRDTIFFATNGIEVEALDYSVIAVEILDKVAKEKRLPVKPWIFDVKNSPLPFPDGYFNAVYSHMLLNMRFSLEELHFIFSEIRRVLKPKGLNFFSVRNHNDKSYDRGIEIDKGIYDINGFQIRFFTEKEMRDLAAAEGFEILWIKEEYEEPVTLYLVSSRRTSKVVLRP